MLKLLKKISITFPKLYIIYNCLTSDPPKPHVFATEPLKCGLYDVIVALTQSIPDMITVFDNSVTEFENALEEVVRAESHAESVAESKPAEESLEELKACKQTYDEKSEKVYKAASKLDSIQKEIVEEINKATSKIDEIEDKFLNSKAEHEARKVIKEGYKVMDRCQEAMEDYRIHWANAQSKTKD